MRIEYGRALAHHSAVGLKALCSLVSDLLQSDWLSFLVVLVAFASETYGRLEEERLMVNGVYSVKSGDSARSVDRAANFRLVRPLAVEDGRRPLQSQKTATIVLRLKDGFMNVTFSPCSDSVIST